MQQPHPLVSLLLTLTIHVHVLYVYKYTTSGKEETLHYYDNVKSECEAYGKYCNIRRLASTCITKKSQEIVFMMLMEYVSKLSCRRCEV